MEKISILVPCCNVEQYVRECLESIKNQTYTNLEVICINDGSTDSTGEIIDEFVAADSRFKAIHKVNTGYGDSMNRGLEQATGDYIGIVESDDWIEPDMYETLLNTAKQHDLDLVRCSWYEGPTGTETENHQSFVKKDTVQTLWLPDSVFVQQPSIWAALYRRDLIEDGRKVRFLPTPGASYQDTSFAFKTYTKSKRFMMLERPLHHYRINPQSSVSSSNKLYCIVDEWEEMRRWIMGSEELKQKFSSATLLAKICHGGFVWNYERLSTHVYKLLFLRRASKFFRQAYEDGILMPKEKADKIFGGDLLLVINSPLDYHRQRIAERLKLLPSVLDSRPSAPDLITVVVCCYNTSKYIYSALQSILNQTYSNLEIICVDDCSTDDSPVQVRHLMRHDKRISFISTNQNSGLSATRNFGLQHATGKYVAFVDGDDMLVPNAIELLYNSMGDDVDVVVGSTLIDYEGGADNYGNLPGSDKDYYSIKKIEDFNAIENLKSARRCHVSAWGKLWRTDVILQNDIKFPEGLLYEDACFYWKYLLIAPRVHTITSQVYFYQRHLTGSIMSETFSKKPGMSVQHLLILDDIYAFGCSHNKKDETRRVLAANYESYFFFALINAPQSDYDLICQTMCRILNEQEAGEFKTLIMRKVREYDRLTKGELFVEAYDKNVANGGVKLDKTTYRLTRKLKKYRKLTRLFALIAVGLLLLSVVLSVLLCIK